MRRPLALLCATFLVATSLLGCETPTAVPAGAQIVQVRITDSSVVLEPDTVSASDVYLSLESPASGAYAFVARQESADATPGPLTDDGIEALRRGDTFLTSIQGITAGGCDPTQDAEARGKMGHCGNVAMVVVFPGRYAIVGGSPERDPSASAGDSPPMAILTVVP